MFQNLSPSPDRGDGAADDDAVLLERAHRAYNGAKFAALWAGERTAYAFSSEKKRATRTATRRGKE
jgi:hypothetical protein